MSTEAQTVDPVQVVQSLAGVLLPQCWQRRPVLGEEDWSIHRMLSVTPTEAHAI